MLAILARNQISSSHIMTIQDAQGSLYFQTNDILKVFRSFYTYV